MEKHVKYFKRNSPANKGECNIIWSKKEFPPGTASPIISNGKFDVPGEENTETMCKNALPSSDIIEKSINMNIDSTAVAINEMPLTLLQENCKLLSVVTSSSSSSQTYKYPTKTWRQLKQVSVARRLQFDDQDREPGENEPEDERDDRQINGSVASASSGFASGLSSFACNSSSFAFDLSTAEKDDGDIRAVSRALSARGLVVDDVMHTWSADHVDKSYKCVSLLEGCSYAVTVAPVDDGGLARAIRALAAVGPHPHVVAYFSGWIDTRFRYMQTELCTADLWSTAAAGDCRTVLEHVACALHHLHDSVGYAHNSVDGHHIFRVGNVYKLGGFHNVTELKNAGGPSDGRVHHAATLADVASLCETVSQLLRRDDDADLRSYLSFIADDSGSDFGALTVWRWCRSTTAVQRQRERQRRQSLAAISGWSSPPSSSS